MSRHRKNNPHRVAKRVAASVGAVATLATLTATASPAHALLEPSDKSIGFSNNDVVGHCRLEVKAVDAVNGTVDIKLTAYAQPKTLTGYGTNVFTGIDCLVSRASGGEAVAEEHIYKNSAVITATSIFATVPFDTSYTLCGGAFVTLKSGTTSYTPAVCG